MYDIEFRLAPSQGYHTPAQARAHYGRYSRTGITVHWWNTPDAAGTHNATVNYILRKAQAGTGSVNYVVSDAKITLMVGPDNVAWASQGGNPTTISVEFDPRLTNAGYKKGGWLIWQLEQRYNRKLALFPHNHWLATQCPGTISLNRLRTEANKWARGDYDPKPTPTPKPPAKADLKWEKWDSPQVMTPTKKTIQLWEFDKTAWSQFPKKGVLEFKDRTDGKPTEITIYGQVSNLTLGSVFYLTEHSYTRRIANGFNAVDMEKHVPPSAPLPEPPKEQEDLEPPEEPAPEIPAEESEYDKRLTTLESAVESLTQLVSKIISFLDGLFKNWRK